MVNISFNLEVFNFSSLRDDKLTCFLFIYSKTRLVMLIELRS